ncbi:MAG TPA: glycosyltransferase family 4 protein [Leptolyngbyaceae cyanobacterium]
MKVSLIVSDLSGGGSVRAFLLGQVLKKLNYQVEIVGFLFGKGLYAIPPQGMEIVSFTGNKYPQLLKTIPKILNKIDGDIIYAVKPKPTSFGISLIKTIFKSRPLLLDMDDWELSWYGGDEWKYHPTPKQLYRDMFKKDGALRYPDHPLYVKWMESLVQKADLITIDTQFLKNRFGGVYLPNGKDTEMFDPEKYDRDDSKVSYGLSPYRILMFPGAPRPHKGVEDVLIALDRLNEPDLRLVIVGGSPYDDYDDKLIQQWGRWIIKLPRCPVEEMPKVLAAADVVVVPQRNDIAARAQFPLKLTDGMAMAKPILSTKVGDIPEILDGTGYLVEPGSPDEIAQKIQWIFQNFDEAVSRGKAARERCVKYYSLYTMSDILSGAIANL